MHRSTGGKNKMVILLAVSGMLCWGIAPIFAKIGLSNVNPLAALALRTFFAACLIFSWVAIDGTLIQVKNIPRFSLVLIGMEAILATVVGDLAYYAAIKKGDVSLVTIIMSSSPLITILFAVIFLGEQITLFRALGTALIILGIFLVV